jgi:CRISPR-associated protein Cmr1
MNAPQHRPEHPVAKFPRAAFGMPIIFHFKDNGDPRDGSLQPENFERMASPLFLRPLWVEGKWRAAALILEVPGRAKVSTVLGKERVDTTLTPAEIEQIKPLQGHEGADVLSRFMSYFTAANGAAPQGGQPQIRRN